MLGRRHVAVRLLPRVTGRHEDDLVEVEPRLHLGRRHQVAVVDRVEGAAHDPDPAGPGARAGQAAAAVLSCARVPRRRRRGHRAAPTGSAEGDPAEPQFRAWLTGSSASAAMVRYDTTTTWRTAYRCPPVQRTWPSPVTTYLVDVISGSPIGPAGVQLLGADADLGAEAELAAVGEPGRGVDQHRRRVDRGGEPPGGGLVLGDDRVGVLAGEAPDVLDRLVEVGYDARRRCRGRGTPARSPRRWPARPRRTPRTPRRRGSSRRPPAARRRPAAGTRRRRRRAPAATRRRCRRWCGGSWR